MERRSEQIETARPIEPLLAQFSPDQIFERRELFGAGHGPVIRKTEYRLDAARSVPDFSPFMECWDRGHRNGHLPTARDFADARAANKLAAIHLVDTSPSDPTEFRFLEFDCSARSDDRDLSGTPLREYPDPVIQNSGIQDCTTAVLGKRGTVMEISVTTDAATKKFARLMLPIAANEQENQPSQLISIVRLLEYRRRSESLQRFSARAGANWALPHIAPTAFHAVPTQSSARLLLMRYFHNGNQELLADQDLLEMLLKQSEVGDECRELAESLIDEFGSLPAVMAVGSERLVDIPGMTPQALVRLKVAREMASRMIRMEMIDKPVFSGTGVVLDYCRSRMAHETVEHVRVLYLDQKNRLIVDEPFHGGGVASVPINPRHIVKRAVILDAQSIVMAHNHPSGDPSPSGADVEVTMDLKRATEAVGVRLLDHLIIGRSGHVSLRTLGYLDDR